MPCILLLIHNYMFELLFQVKHTLKLEPYPNRFPNKYSFPLFGWSVETGSFPTILMLLVSAYKHHFFRLTITF